jgi:hypothetical protein
MFPFCTFDTTGFLHRSPRRVLWAAALLAGATPGVSHSPLGAQAGEESWITDFSRHTVPLEEIVSGGPPKDGIPALDRPVFETVKEADGWLADEDPVAVVRIGDEVKAYPLQILIWHEIVNDEVGGVPVTVTFCPLCNTTLAFNRVFDGRRLDFGTTGRLRHSDMVMYDRQTESWWQQATGEGIIGEYAGRRLALIPAPVLSWKEVKTQLKGAQVLSRETGYRRSYGTNPYTGYDRGAGPIASFFRVREDDRLPAMERIVALDGAEGSKAIPFSVMKEEGVLETTLDGERLVVFWAPGTSSALDAERISLGRDVGSTAVYSAMMDGRLLTFEPQEGGLFRDRETGSIWSLSGTAIRGPLLGRTLESIPHGNHFWFAWAVFKPETKVIRGG